MVNCTAALSVLLMSSMFGRKPPREPTAEELIMDASLRKVETRLTELDDKFKESINITFYEPQEAGTDPLKAISCLMSECNAVLYAAEKRALNVTKEILLKHFVGEKKTVPRGMEHVLWKNKNLVDMMANRVMMAAMQDAFEAVLDRRKKIYLLLNAYRDEPGLKRLRLEFFDIVTLKGYVLMDATRGTDECYDKYLADVAGIMPAVDKLNIRPFALEIIDDAVYHDNIRSHKMQPEEYDLLETWVGNDLMHKIRDAELRTIDTVTRFTDREISDVTEDDLHKMRC